MAIAPFTPEQHRDWHNSLPAKPTAVGLICLNQEGKMLAVKASYKDHWSLPGGVIDENESPRLAALRELQEETAITLAVDQLQFADVIYHYPKDGKRDLLHFLFIAKNVDAQATPDEHEITEAKWVTPNEFKQLCKNHPHLLRAAEIASGSTPPLYLENTH
jgi:8-oxo-dGTP diphosphatase